MDNQQGPSVQHMEPAQCYVQSGCEGSLGENGHLRMLWLSPLAVYITTLLISLTSMQNEKLKKLYSLHLF